MTQTKVGVIGVNICSGNLNVVMIY